MADTTIEWTDAVWNPLRGCARVSDGCKNCYAERVAMRFSGQGQPYHGLVQMTSQGPKWTGRIELVPKKLEEPLRASKPRKYFVNSMSDLFHENVPFEFIDQVFAVMALSWQHTFQILTKRAARMHEYMMSRAGGRHIWIAAQSIEMPGGRNKPEPPWPLPNVWLGVSAEDQMRADERIPFLLDVPAAVRWVSAEPLLGLIDLCNIARIIAQTNSPLTTRTRIDALRGLAIFDNGTWSESCERIDWVVVGGESGPNARPMHPDWATSLRDQCAVAGVKFFHKQWGEWVPMIAHAEGVPVHGPKFTFSDGTIMGRAGKKSAGRLLEGRTHDEYPEGK